VLFFCSSSLLIFCSKSLSLFSPSPPWSYSFCPFVTFLPFLCLLMPSCFCFDTCLKNLPSLRHSDHPSPTHTQQQQHGQNMTWHHKYQQYHSFDFTLTLIDVLWYTLSHTFTFFLPRLCDFVMPPHPSSFFSH